MGLHPEKTACVRGSNADTNTVHDLLAAGARGSALPPGRGRRTRKPKNGVGNELRGLIPAQKKGPFRHHAGTGLCRAGRGARTGIFYSLKRSVKRFHRGEQPSGLFIRFHHGLTC